MALMSSFDFWVVPLGVAIAAFLCWGRFKGRAMIFCVLLVLAVGDGLVGNTLKKLVHRPRPNEAMPDVRMVDLQKNQPRLLTIFKPPAVKFSSANPGISKNGRSFPSSHVINNFCVAVVLTYFFRRYGWLYFLAAALVAYSRIYVGSHWPSDVICSIVIAFLVTWPLLVLLEWLWRKYGPRLMPRIHTSHPSLLCE
jgi:undecaprenyl-diphosphatase